MYNDITNSLNMVLSELIESNAPPAIPKEIRVLQKLIMAKLSSLNGSEKFSYGILGMYIHTLIYFNFSKY